MTTPQPLPLLDAYGYARAPETIGHIQYGRFRNVYLYITERCQLRCAHCYMGERLARGITMPVERVYSTLRLWRKMGGSKLTILGGEPTLHRDFVSIIRFANAIGYEKVILTTNGLKAAARKLHHLSPDDFSYVQVSVDGSSPYSHDAIRGSGTFATAWQTVQELASRGFDTRVICTVNRRNIDDCLDLLPMADAAGVSLVKFHVFSGIGNGLQNTQWLISPSEWIEFYEHLEELRTEHRTQIWYQPTYARLSKLQHFADEGYRGCIGRTLDRISIFPDGRCYVCSYLFDTSLNFATMENGEIHLNRGPNEFELFTGVLTSGSCGTCKSEATCMGGCPAEQIVMGGASCLSGTDIVPVCRLWKSDVV